MSDFLDDRLATLREAPLPPLAEAGVVRARGDQRRHRTRIAGGVAAVATVLALAGTAAALSRGGPDALQYAPAPSPSCAPADCLDEDEVHVAVPEGPATLSPEAPLVASTQLLDESDAARAGGPGWAQGRVRQDLAFGLTVCPTGDGYAGEGLSRTLTRGKLSVTSQVVRVYDGTAERAGIEAEVAECPHGSTGKGASQESYRLLAAPDKQTTVVRREVTHCASACQAPVRIWVVVAAPELVAFVSLPESELPHVAAWAKAARAHLTSGSHPAGYPDDVQPGQGTVLYAVYLAWNDNARADDADRLAARGQARQRGYEPGSGDVSCDQGAAAALGSPDRTVYAVSLYFANRSAAEQFVTAWRADIPAPAISDPIQVTTYCAD